MSFSGKGAASGGFLGGFYEPIMRGLKNMTDPNKLTSLDPNQQGIHDQSYQALQGGGGPLGDIYGFDPNQVTDMYNQSVAQPAYQNFQEQVIPGITGQFRGQNLQNSSYLGGALGKAGSDVQQGLDSGLQQILYQSQQDSLQRKQKGVSDLMNTQTFAYQQSPVMQLLSAMAGQAGKAAGAYAGGMG